MATGHQDVGVQLADAASGATPAVVGQQGPDEVVVHTHAAHQGVGGGDLQLGLGSGGQTIGGFLEMPRRNRACSRSWRIRV